MQGIPSVMHCLCHSGVSAIISESGRNLGYSEGSLCFTLEWPQTDYATVLQHTRNCTICATHKLITSLKGYLGLSRSGIPSFERPIISPRRPRPRLCLDVGPQL